MGQRLITPFGAETMQVRVLLPRYRVEAKKNDLVYASNTLLICRWKSYPRDQFMKNAEGTTSFCQHGKARFDSCLIPHGSRELVLSVSSLLSSLNGSGRRRKCERSFKPSNQGSTPCRPIARRKHVHLRKQVHDRYFLPKN